MKFRLVMKIKKMILTQEKSKDMLTVCPKNCYNILKIKIEKNNLFFKDPDNL